MVAVGSGYISPVKGVKDEAVKLDPESANNPLIFPDDEILSNVVQFDSAALNNQTYIEQWQQLLGAYLAEPAMRAGTPLIHAIRTHRWLAPGSLLTPPPPLAGPAAAARAGAGLAIFFLVPLGFLAYQSLQSGTFEQGYSFTWEFSNYRDAITGYDEQLVRSFFYAGLATVATLLISYPLVYWIAFHGGRWKNMLLLLIVAPFFVTYLIRTLAWQNILADQGPVVGFLRDVHVLSADGRLLATTFAVVSGITYNFLPFMALPLYVSLEQIDARLLEAAQDLYASKTKAFLRVTLPLSAPGIVAGTLLTFIPAAGDFINAQLLGTPNQYMIGNVIQSKFLELIDYPAAAALSFVLMALIMVALLVYARVVGTEKLTG